MRAWSYAPVVSQRHGRYPPSSGDEEVAVADSKTLTVDQAVALGASLQQSGRLAEAQRLYEDVLKADPEHADATHLLGVLAMQQGRAPEAIEYIQRAIALAPENSTYFANLGAILQAQGAIDGAIRALERACELEPSFPVAHKNLGSIYEDAGRYEDAVVAYRRALDVDPEYAEAHNNLGIALRQLGDFEGSVASYLRALKIRPRYVKARLNLGVTYSDLGQFEQAEIAYRKALELKPDLPAGWNNLGNTLRNQGVLEEAEHCLRRAIELQPDLASAYNNLGNLLGDLDKLDEAIDVYSAAVHIDPTFADAFRNLGLILARRGRMDEAIEKFRAVLGLQSWPMGELLVESLCPLVFNDREAVLGFRRGLLETLNRFAEQTFEVDSRDILSLAACPSFNLPFHGEDDRVIKEAYARVFSRYFRTPGPAILKRSRRPKVGFVVTHGHEGIFMRSLSGVIERLDRERFEPVIACSPAASAVVREKLPAEIGVVVLPGMFGALIDRLRDARLDLLYFWEIAVDWVSYFLPYHRLAPVQCTSWGIQVTSGIPTMDYYLSSALVETDDADAHYTETLLRARTLLTYKNRVARPTSVLPRSHFGFGEGQHLYVCAQNLGKIHPDFDSILAGILRRDPNGIIVLTGDRNESVTMALRKRLDRTLGDTRNRVKIIPRQKPNAYLSLLINADVLLDPIHFGGVNSTYDGLSFGKPIVTWPSTYQRGRYTLGCYRKMEVLDCVANGADEYVDLAVRLGRDRDARSSLEAKLLEASEALFRDEEAVREHERLFAYMLEA